MYNRKNLLRISGEKKYERLEPIFSLLFPKNGVRKMKAKKFIISVLFPSDVINGSSTRKNFSKRIIPLMPVI